MLFLYIYLFENCFTWLQRIFIVVITLPDYDAVETAHGIRISAASTILQTDLVYGNLSRYVNYHYHHGYSSVMREE